MEAIRFRSVISRPCACCNAQELNALKQAHADSEEKHWIYNVRADSRCGRCYMRPTWKEMFETLFLLIGFHIFRSEIAAFIPYTGWIEMALWAWFYHRYIRKNDKPKWVQVPIAFKTVGTVERAIHAASVASKGAEFRAHGTFIHHLSLMEADEELKQSLCAWAPLAMMSFMEGENGVTRKKSAGRPIARAEPSETTSTHEGNPDLSHFGSGELDDMPGTRLKGDEYGEEDRVKGQNPISEDKILGVRIGPDLIPTEVMQSTEENLKAGLSKRVRPLGYRASANMTRKIEKMVSELIKVVFTPAKIKNWREQNPSFDDFKSKKWSGERWRNAVMDTLADTHAKIEQEFQIKVNEALPAKDKAPRPIIQCGDKAQVMMSLPVKCFEELLFEHFEDASIKHTSKHDAMLRVAKHLRHGKNVHTMEGHGEKICTVEGDGSAWDSCCNPKIRNLTENRIISHIIEVLGDDPEVPETWMQNCLNDMKKNKLKGKAKVDGRKNVAPIRVIIESIRQSGHRGTSCFNWLINYVCWMCVIAENPEDMIAKVKKGGKECLPSLYTSAVDGQTYQATYAFEGDDSALTTTESFNPKYIEKEWLALGFRMKLVYVDEKMTFTGFDFLCDNRGPTGICIPEIPRNIASSSWSCSALLKQHPEKRHEVGMDAYYARAENFKDCGPLCKYFAELGLAHSRKCSDHGLGEAEAVSLGVHETNSVVSQLHKLAEEADVLDAGARKLVQQVVPDWSEYYETRLLGCYFKDPFDTDYARTLLPKSLWDPAKYSQARR